MSFFWLFIEEKPAFNDYLLLMWQTINASLIPGRWEQSTGTTFQRKVIMVCSQIITNREGQVMNAPFPDPYMIPSTARQQVSKARVPPGLLATGNQLFDDKVDLKLLP